MHRLIDAGLVANVGAGRKAQAPHQTGAQVADDVAVQVGRHQRVELLGALHQLHAQRVNDAVIGGNVGVVLRHLPESGQEQPVRQLHDVGLVHAGDLFAAVGAGIVKGKAADALAGSAGDELDAVGGVLIQHVFDALVQVLSVFPHDDQIDLIKPGGHAGQRAHRAQVGVGVEPLAQLHVDAAEALADGGGGGAFQRPAAVLDGVQRAGGDQLAVGGGILRSRLKFLPLDAGVQHVRDGTHTLGDLPANAVARYQNCLHTSPLSSVQKIIQLEYTRFSASCQ